MYMNYNEYGIYKKFVAFVVCSLNWEEIQSLHIEYALNIHLQRNGIAQKGDKKKKSCKNW